MERKKAESPRPFYHPAQAEKKEAATDNGKTSLPRRRKPSGERHSTAIQWAPQGGILMTTGLGNMGVVGDHDQSGLQEMVEAHD